ncbi:MAG TPA: pantoate--beta-alanine ligase [Pseudonocardia sp.]|nr:pantoate--beta-alanine ligase [Pseudonocardia sp.]
MAASSLGGGARTLGGYAPGALTVHRSPAEIAPVTRALRAAGRKVALVPTMGALHEGHRELIRHARRAPGAVVPAVSIFVNPLQFGAGEDLDRYPRPLEADLEVCREEGVELVFLPGVADMYPEGADTAVTPGLLGDRLEGAVRPGHFAGVLTVVAKLFHIVGPDLAFFGEKDYQQLVLVQKMVRDLDFPLSVVGVPTVREEDGLAISSRNAYLSPDDRRRAPALQRALAAGAAVSARGPRAVLDAARAVLADAPALQLEYLELTDPDLGPDPGEGRARLLAAARIGGTRLIDNVPVRL